LEFLPGAPKYSLEVGPLLRPSQSATGPALQRGTARIHYWEPLNAIDPSRYKSWANVQRYGRLTLL